MSSSLTVRRIAADQGPTLRELRTAALREAPYAFGQTLEEALHEQTETFEAIAALRTPAVIGRDVGPRDALGREAARHGRHHDPVLEREGAELERCGATNR